MKISLTAAASAVALAACLTTVAALSAAAQTATTSPEGQWLTPGGSATVRIRPCAARADRLCGTIVALRQPNGADGRPVRDAANPDRALRTRPVVGIDLVRDFRADGRGRWSGGRIYNPQDGKTYNSRMRLNPDGTLRIEGCVLVVCQGQTWTRAPG